MRPRPFFGLPFTPLSATTGTHITSTRFNNVHFYFSSYHVFSNCCLRKIKTSFQPGFKRRLLYIYAVLVMSYFTAFMETLTISSFPYYSFQDRNMAYTVGSAFYGIYFLVSFPAFLEFDRDIDIDVNVHNVHGSHKQPKKIKYTSLWDTIVESCGYGMMILCMLDFVRLYLGLPLVAGS